MEHLSLEELIEQRPRAIPEARFITCEQRPFWGVALMRTSPDLRPLLCETRSLHQARETLQASPRSFLALELNGSNLETLLELLRQITKHFPRAHVSILSQPAFLDAEWIMRHAGAVDFLVSLSELRALSEVARIHFSLPGTQSLPYGQTVWERLPWRSVHDKKGGI